MLIIHLFGMDTGGDVERMDLAQRMTVAKALKVRTAYVHARVYYLCFSDSPLFIFICS